MIARPFAGNERGTTAVEFGLTAPLFFLFLFAIIETGLVLWTQLGMQHATEMAARCASVNKTQCGSPSAIQSYAVDQAFGLHLPGSTFTVTPSACGTLISASYNYALVTSVLGLPKIPLTAQSCFPN